MNLELFTLCDFAKGEPTGKLYIIGTFDHVFAPEAPVPMPPSAIASRLRFGELEQGSHRVAVSFVDSDGVKVIPDITAQMGIQLPPGESTVTVNVVVVLPQIKLPRFGEYSIDLAVDAREEASLPLYVRQATNPNPPLRLTSP
jgi:hypothetical protein